MDFQKLEKIGNLNKTKLLALAKEFNIKGRYRMKADELYTSLHELYRKNILLPKIQIESIIEAYKEITDTNYNLNIYTNYDQIKKVYGDLSKKYKFLNKFYEKLIEEKNQIILPELNVQILELFKYYNTTQEKIFKILIEKERDISKLGTKFSKITQSPIFNSFLDFKLKTHGEIDQ